MGKTLWENICAVYFRFSDVTETLATISTGLHKSDLGPLLTETLGKFLATGEIERQLQ